MKVRSRLFPVSIISLLCLFSIMLGSVNLTNLSDFINPVDSASAMSFQSEQDIAFTINPTVNITVSGDLVINNLTPGDYKDSNIITVTASSNALAGYTLSSTVGNSTHTSPSFNNTNLNHTNGTNTFINLATSKTSLSDFDSSSNTWGYSWCNGTCNTSTASTSWVSGNVGSTQTGYNGLPIYTTSSPIQLVNSNSAGTSTISFKIGARATSTQVSGTFANIVNFIGVGKVITTTYTISYNANGGSDAPNTQTGTTTNGAVELSSSQPTKSDYIFKGWCTIDNTSDPTACTGTGAEIIQPSSFLALEPGTSSSTATVTKTLYAVWESNTAKTYMQNLPSSSCTTTATTVYDNRDEEPYLIQRLADGNCWMLDNLRLDITDSTIMNGLTTTNTNVDAASLTSLKSGNRSAGNQYASSGFEIWDSNHISDVYNQAKANADDKDTVASVTYGSGSGKIGVYYNYCAASAGSYCYDTAAGTGNASYDLCPAGWRMPTGGSSDEYDILYTNGYSSDQNNFENALSTPFSGYFSGGSASSQGSYGYFWSSTYANGYYMYGLFVDSSYVRPSNYSGRCYGSSLRCILSSS